MTLESHQVIILTKDDTVRVTLSGYSAADVQWRINGSSLEELGVDRSQVLPGGSLLIRDVRRSDAGRYTVYISSLNLPAGTPAEIINVTVQGILCNPFFSDNVEVCGTLRICDCSGLSVMSLWSARTPG